MVIGTRLEAYDLLGLLLAGTLATWFVASAVAGAGAPFIHVGVLALAVGSYGSGRALGRDDAMLGCGAVVGAILITTVASGPSAFSGGPLAPPLGYANANGALFYVGVAAAAAIALLADRAIGTVLVLSLVGLTVVTTSKAAVALALGIALTALIARRLGRSVALAAPVVVAAPIAMTVALASEGLASTTLEAGLTDRRIDLWRDAIEIVASRPVAGVGPGMFAETSGTALGDADAVWAHSAYLEVAAENGLPGVVLLMALLLWVFGALYRSRQDPRLVVAGTAAVAAVSIHAAIDYVVHFPVVLAAVAFVAGLSSTRTAVSVAREPASSGERRL